MTSQGPQTNSRVDVALELESIRTLKYRYCDLCDQARMDEVADLFTQDAVCDLGPSFGGVMRTRAGIRAGFGRFVDIAAPYGTLHMVTNPMLQLTDPTSAIGRWYLHEFLLIDPTRSSPTLSVGMYRDSYRKVGEDWLIAETSLEVYWSAALEAP